MNEVTLRGNFVYSDYQEAGFALGVKVFSTAQPRARRDSRSTPQSTPASTWSSRR